jgi:hypothetical protein
VVAQASRNCGRLEPKVEVFGVEFGGGWDDEKTRPRFDHGSQQKSCICYDQGEVEDAMLALAREGGGWRGSTSTLLRRATRTSSSGLVAGSGRARFAFGKSARRGQPKQPLRSTEVGSVETTQAGTQQSSRKKLTQPCFVELCNTVCPSNRPPRDLWILRYISVYATLSGIWDFETGEGN